MPADALCDVAWTLRLDEADRLDRLLVAAGAEPSHRARLEAQTRFADDEAELVEETNVIDLFAAVSTVNAAMRRD